jgi:hypothetical protein
MGIRSLVAVATVAAFGLVSCGGDSGPSTLSEDEFVDQMADICQDTVRDLDRIDTPETLADLEDTAKDGIEVLTDTRERLGELVPPEDLADDFDDFVANVDDQIDALEDLGKAGADEDEGAVNDVSETMDELSTRRSELGDDLGVDECAEIEDDTDTTDPDTTDPDTTGPGSTDGPDQTVADDTVPPVSGPPPSTPPLTLPSTVPPQTTPVTVAPATVPPATLAPATGPQFDVVDLSTVFVAPDGFTLEPGDPTAQQDFVNALALVPVLNEGIQEMGVGVLVSEDGVVVATIVVGVAISDSMPGEWKDILCTNGTLRTSGDGYTGIQCPGAPGSGVYEIFTLTEGDLGLSIASLDDRVPADLVADAFFEANL